MGSAECSERCVPTGGSCAGIVGNPGLSNVLFLNDATASELMCIMFDLLGGHCRCSPWGGQNMTQLQAISRGVL